MDVIFGVNDPSLLDYTSKVDDFKAFLQIDELSPYFNTVMNNFCRLIDEEIKMFEKQFIFRDFQEFEILFAEKSILWTALELYVKITANIMAIGDRMRILNTIRCFENTSFNQSFIEKIVDKSEYKIIRIDPFIYGLILKASDEYYTSILTIFHNREPSQGTVRRFFYSWVPTTGHYFT